MNARNQRHPMIFMIIQKVNSFFVSFGALACIAYVSFVVTIRCCRWIYYFFFLALFRFVFNSLALNYSFICTFRYLMCFSILNSWFLISWCLPSALCLSIIIICIRGRLTEAFVKHSYIQILINHNMTQRSSIQLSTTKRYHTLYSNECKRLEQKRI